MANSNALFKRNTFVGRIFSLSVILCLAFSTLAVSALAQTRSYDVEGLPFMKDVSTSQELGNRFTFEVTDTGSISAVTVDLTLYSQIQLTDIKLISPAGTVVWLTDWNCSAQPIYFGEKIYENPDAHLFPQSRDAENNPGDGEPRGTGGPGIPMTYLFSDSGRHLGAGYRETTIPALGDERREDSGLCAEYNARTTELPPVWPPIIDPANGVDASRRGAYWTLPTSQLIAPGRLASGLGAASGGNRFSDFEGEDPSGTWALEIDAYGFEPTLSVWDRVNTLIQAATVNISTTEFSANAPNIVKQPELESNTIGQSTRLIYTIDNSSSVETASSLAFDDALPSDFFVTDTIAPTTTCGGTVSATVGDNAISYSGGQVLAGESCEISVSFSSEEVGTYGLEAVVLSSSLGNSRSAASEMQFTAASAFDFSMSFAQSSIALNGATELIYRFDNSLGAEIVSNFQFDHYLPDGLVLDGLGPDIVNLPNACSGPGHSILDPNNQSIRFLSYQVDAGDVCDVSIPVRGTIASTLETRTSTLIEQNVRLHPPAAASLTVLDGSETPKFSKSFRPQSIPAGQGSSLVYTISAGSLLTDVSKLSFSDELPSNILFDPGRVLANTCSDASALGISADRTQLSLFDGSVSAGQACTITIGIEANTPGEYPSVSEDLMSTAGNSGPAIATLVATSPNAPIFSKSFSPVEIAQGEVSRLTYQVDNSANFTNASSLAFSETLPDGLQISGNSAVETTCGGLLSATSGSQSITFSGGVVLAEWLCTIEVAIVGIDEGSFTATSGELTSSLGDSGPSSAEITVLDVTPPTVVISAETESFVDLAPIKVTFTFSEDVTGFAIEDIVLGSGTAAQFEAVSGAVYTAAITPTGKGDLSIDVPEGVANDLSDSVNPNLAAEQLTIENGIIALTQRAIRNFMTARMDTIVSNEPDLFERLTQRPTAASSSQSGFTVDYSADRTFLTFDGSFSALKANFNQEPDVPPFESTIMRRTGLFGANTAGNAEPDTAKFDIWSRGIYSHTTYGELRSKSGLLYVGADWLLNPDRVVGLLSQFDWTDERDRQASTEVSGFGWLAGPYAVQRLTDRLILDGRVAVGQSGNRINPIGRYRDKFDTDRVLVSSQLTGDFEHGLFVINPFVQAIYMEERQNDYTDTLGNLIGEQTVSLGRVNFGPKIRMEVSAQDGTITTTPYIKLEALYDFRGGQRVDFDGQLIDEDRLRGRFTGGFSLISAAGWNVSAEGFSDGHGQSALEAYGATVNIGLSF